MVNKDNRPQSLSKEEALEALNNMKGQRYIRPQRAHELLYPFRNEFTDEFLDGHEHEDNAALAAEWEIAQRQELACDARGITQLFRYESVITAAGASELLVEALGGDPSEAQAVGFGTTADMRHEENRDWLAEHFDGDIQNDE